MNLIQVPYRDGLCHERSNAFIEGTINNQISTVTFRSTLILKRRPFAKNSWRTKIKLTARTGHRCFASNGRSIKSNTMLGMLVSRMKNVYSKEGSVQLEMRSMMSELFGSWLAWSDNRLAYASWI